VCSGAGGGGYSPYEPGALRWLRHPPSVSARGIYVGGSWRLREPDLHAVNPARPSEVVGTFASAAEDDVADACAAAQEALASWRHRPALERATLLHRAAAILEARADTVATDLTREEGKTIGEARGEVLRGVAVLRYFAGEVAQPSGEVYPSGIDGRFLFTMQEPLGVVGVITPWNFPVAIPLWKMAPALAFGNTVVWKPAVNTPTTSVHVTEVLHEAGFPPGVVNLVVGGREPVGRCLVDSPALNGISFTGSERVGRRIQAAVVERGVKVQLELGGKNPVLVLPDADMGSAVKQTVAGAMLSTGQKCTATSRAIVVGAAADPFLQGLLPAVRGLRVGDPLDPAVDVGPLVSADARRTVVSYFDVAREEGLTVGAGGAPLELASGGWFVEPTVYLDVEPESRIAQEEIFGPVLGVMHAADVDEAIEIANRVEFGLSASIFTRDLASAFHFIRHVEAGLVHVNSETTGSEPQVPFGGMKSSSSHSREQGKSARDFFTETKTVFIDMPPDV
jgi:alpha-ketoglutaric semialdehyde dehydrogenase